MNEKQTTKQNSFIDILKRFIKLNHESASAFYLAIFLIILSKVLGALINLCIGNLMDYISSNTMQLFVKGIVILAGIQIVKLIVQYQVNYRVNYLSETCIRRMRSYTYEHITNAGMKWLDDSKLGDIISRINGDLNALVESVNVFLTWQVSSVLSFFVALIICFFLNWKLTLISFSVLPVIGVLQAMTGRPIARLGEDRSRAEGRANAKFMDLIGGLTITKAFGAEKEMYKKYEKEVEDSVKANTKSFALEFLMYPLQMLMGNAPMILVLAAGTVFVIRGDMTFGALLSFVMLSNMAINSVGELSWQIRDIYNTMGIASRIFEIWDVETENAGGSITEEAGGVPVEFKEVTFGYNPEHLVLKGVNFTVKEGEQVALVGTSGSGKSTIIKLLARFYDKTGGSIQLYGNNLEEWNTESLRRKVSYVGQESYLFPESILSNVMLGNRNASREAALEVIKSVGLDSLDVEAPIGERGVMLSGGQRQRVCIARALLKDAKLILLDEPTSALDTESEFYVNQALEKLAKGKTCIMIAHRLSAIHNVDRIICLNNGEIVESGTHVELMNYGGVYQVLYEKQMKEEKNDD